MAPADTAGARERRRMWQLAAVYGAFGIEVAACFLGGALAGHWSDTRFTRAPWGFLFGTVVGCGAAIKAVVRMVRLGRPR